MIEEGHSTNKWYMLILFSFTGMFCMVPGISMPVLFKEISEELGLSLVQMGTIWAASPLAALFMVFISGMFIDRLGIKRVAVLVLVLLGILGAARGLAGDFWSLALSHFAFGLASPSMILVVHRGATIWFRGRQLGTANGVVSMGIGLGLALGAMISASILSPLLGGWRYVFFFYGAISIMLGLLWLFTVREPRVPAATYVEARSPFRHMMSGVVRMKQIWLMGFSLFGYLGCVYAIMGYLPVHLREAGWSAISADGALAILNLAGALGAIPLTLLSDKLGLRKVVILPTMVIVCISSSLLFVFDNSIVWVLVLLIGFSRDANLALLVTMNQEEVSSSKYAGTALALQNALMHGGTVFAPPLGNSLGVISPGAPFLLWATFAVGGAIALLFVRETGRRITRITKRTSS